MYVRKKETILRFLSSSKSHKLAGGVIALIMLSVLMLSAFCIHREAEHHCSGEDCLVCACIRQCEETLRKFGEGAPLVSGIILSAVIILLSVCFKEFPVLNVTPVSRKVRLNN